MEFVVQALAATLSTCAPVMYASQGAILSERAGILNLGLEGVMLVGAVTAYITGVKTGSLPAAVSAAILAGGAIGLFYAFMTVTLRANQVVCGLALVTVGTGLSGFLGKTVYGTATTAAFGKAAVPGLSAIPFVGPVFFNQDPMVYALYFLVPASAFYLYKTRPGLRLRALGANPGALDAAGFPVYAMQYAYVVIGCAIVALGGAYVTLAYTPAWIAGITAGKGWIAAALVIFSNWNPVRAALGAVLFGGVEVLGLRLQVMGVAVPSFFISMLPYICTVAALILSTGNFRRRKPPTPVALGQYYDREAR